MHHRILVAFLVAASLVGGTAVEAHATVPCIAFVTGHRAGTQTTADKQFNAGQAPDGTASYWNGGGNMLQIATAGYAVKYAVINYDTYKYYWDAAAEVSDNLNYYCTTGSWIVTHSMGGRILSWILGNSVSGDPYYNYGGKNYAGVRAKYNTWFSVSGAHDGTEAAAAVCGNASTACNWMADVVSWFADTTCDIGTQSLQHNQSPQYENGSRITSLLVGGYEAITGSSACLEGEDDGLIEYASIYFCNDHPDDGNSVGYDRFCSSLEDVDDGFWDGCGDTPANRCQSTNKQRSGYRNYDSGHENHNDTRNAADRGDKRRAVAEGYWGECSPGTSCDYGWSGSAADEIGWFVSSGYNSL